MPVYEYSCPNCGKFEIVQKITENSLQTCPFCDSKVKRLISQTLPPRFLNGGTYTKEALIKKT